MAGMVTGVAGQPLALAPPQEGTSAETTRPEVLEPRRVPGAALVLGQEGVGTWKSVCQNNKETMLSREM